MDGCGVLDSTRRDPDFSPSDVLGWLAPVSQAVIDRGFFKLAAAAATERFSAGPSALFCASGGRDRPVVAPGTFAEALQTLPFAPKTPSSL
jgi:hypothetical protein